MTGDERKILKFCMEGWRNLGPLGKEIPHSTLYQKAKNLSGRRLLLHRRKRGYKTTQRGIQALREDRSQVEVLQNDMNITKKQLTERERAKVEEKPPVNLGAIQKLLELSDKKINFFLSLYPPLKKVPTPTHEAMIELLWAEICDRNWPVTEDHHLNFLNFGHTFAWKTNSGKFCAHMEAGKEITPYILDLSREGGCSLWVRKTPAGKIIFKREILDKAYVCLDNYLKADENAKKAAAHLLTGEMKIALENKIQIIRCTPMVNLNPREGVTVFEKTGFDRPAIRRFIPCNLDAVKLPDLKRVGQEPLDMVKDFGPFEKKKPTSSCGEYREELLNYFEVLFTQEGQSYIDIEGLLNIARGFTGYGFTPSEAIRYTLYKVSLPYHTLGWLQPKWTQEFHKKASLLRLYPPSISYEKSERMKVDQVRKKEPKNKTGEEIEATQKEIEIAIKLKPEHDKLIELIEGKIGSLQSAPEHELWQFLLPEEKEKFNAALSSFKILKPRVKRIKMGDWEALKAFKALVSQVMKDYFLPLQEIGEKARKRAIVKRTLSKIEKANTLQELKEVTKDMDESSLDEEERGEIRKAFEEKKRSLSAILRGRLISYLEKEKNPTEDMTPCFLDLELVEKVSIDSTLRLKGVDGKLYNPDDFNFSKYQGLVGLFNPLLNVIPLDYYRNRALSLLTGKEHKSALELIEETSQNERLAQERKARAEAERKALPWIIGLGAAKDILNCFQDISRRRTQPTTDSSQVKDIQGISSFQSIKSNSPKKKTLFNQINSLKPKCPACGSPLQRENTLYLCCHKCGERYLQ